MIELGHARKEGLVLSKLRREASQTGSAIGRILLQILRAIAEFEHALMSERTHDESTAARVYGRKPCDLLPEGRFSPPAGGAGSPA
ncbi:recombinase family protein [Nocardia colli]|uniref:recombinase family protein n=1 Tax=Nocardia colli TaxID=2545717 RepID=UPI0035DD8D4E